MPKLDYHFFLPYWVELTFKCYYKLIKIIIKYDDKMF